MKGILKGQIQSKAAEPPGSWFGLRFGEKGTHTSRTMMFDELSELLQHCPLPATTPDEFRAVIVADNALGKRTLATRKLTFQRLSELYGLDPAVPIFRVLRRLWDKDRAGRPMLAFLVAYARDPLLRATAGPMLRLAAGQPVTTAMLDQELSVRLGSRLNPAVRHKVARNAGSSWTQSGHLAGRGKKVRTTPQVTPPVVAMAILLGTVAGAHGRVVFLSEYAALLDCPSSRISPLLQEAHRVGVMNFKQAGEIIEVRFPDLLTESEEARINGI